MTINPMTYISLLTGQRGTIAGLEAQDAPSYEGPERRNVETLGRRLSDIPETLLGCSLITAGQDASRYLEALERGETERLRSMLRTAVEVGDLWRERMGKGL